MLPMQHSRTRAYAGRRTRSSQRWAQRCAWRCQTALLDLLMLMHVVARHEEEDARDGETEQEARELEDGGGRVISRFVSCSSVLTLAFPMHVI